MTYYEPEDFKKFRGGIRLDSIPTTKRPKTPADDASSTIEEGTVYFDKDDKVIKVFDGDDYKEVGSSSSGGSDVFYAEDFRTLPTIINSGGNAAVSITSSGLSENSLLITQQAAATNSERYFSGSPNQIIPATRQKGNTCTLSFWYTFNGSDDKIKIVVKSKNSSDVWTTLTSSSDLLKTASTAKKFITTFTVPSDSVELQWGFDITAENDKLLIVDDVEMSQDPFVQADLGTITEWETFTPVGNKTTNVTYTGKKRRVGDTMEYQVRMTFSGTTDSGDVEIGTGAGNFLGDGLIDTNKIATQEQFHMPLGDFVWETSGINHIHGHVVYSAANAVKLRLFFETTAYESGGKRFVTGSTTSSGNPTTLGNGVEIHCNFKVPIVGLGSTNTHIVTPAKSNLTDWTSYTPTTSFTNTTPTGKWRRVGDSMEIQAKVECTGSPASANLTIDIPSGYTVDTSKLEYDSDSGGYYPATGGNAVIFDDGVQLSNGTCFLNDTSNTIQVRCFQTNSDGEVNSGNVSNTFPFSFGADDSVIIHCSFPITGWSTDGTDHFLAALPMTKWKKKILTYDVEQYGYDLDGIAWNNSEKQMNLTGDGTTSANTGNSDFIFNNVTEGTYRISGQFRLHVDDTAYNANVKIEVRKNSINLIEVDSYHGSSGTAGVSVGTQSLSFSHIFTVDAGSSVNINFMTHDLRGNDKVKGASSGDETFAILEKLPMHEETDIW